MDPESAMIAVTPNVILIREFGEARGAGCGQDDVDVRLQIDGQHAVAEHHDFTVFVVGRDGQLSPRRHQSPASGTQERTGVLEVKHYPLLVLQDGRVRDVGSKPSGAESIPVVIREDEVDFTPDEGHAGHQVEHLINALVDHLQFASNLSYCLDMYILYYF